MNIEELTTKRIIEEALSLKIIKVQLDFMCEDFIFVEDNNLAQKIKHYLMSKYPVEVDIFQKEGKYVVNTSCGD